MSGSRNSLLDRIAPFGADPAETSGEQTNFAPGTN